MTSLFFIFLIAFLLNVVWENMHARLYVHYKKKPITRLILLRAALFDAVFITLVSVLFLFIPSLQQQLWLSVVPGILFAIGLERWALYTRRWAYTEKMPLIPLLNVGITPSLQLGLLTYGTLLIQRTL